MNPDEISESVVVYHRANPGEPGTLTGNSMQAMCVMAEVEWASHTDYVDIEQLEPRRRNSNQNSAAEVQAGRYGTIEDLRRRMTFEKLRGMLTDVFYSMKTSEIDFYPHQFRPVLRFIESATNRLLIADEVGLGKTIEAGLIWTEWQAREKARRLLVVCPPTLIPKWIRELEGRFQLVVEETDPKHLLGLLERFGRTGSSASFVVVTSYHALRPWRKERAHLEQLRAEEDEESLSADEKRRWSDRGKLLHGIWKQAQVAGQNGTDRFLDMVIFDEAHLMKNTGSASYFAGETLSEAARAAICLSATPIHNRSRDLYALLRLIDPDVFRDEFVFDQLRDQNLPIVALQNALSQPGWNPETIRALVRVLPESPAKEELESSLAAFDGTPRSRVEMRHVTERMNLLGNFINRTRKRDVIENRVIRKAITRDVRLSPAEATLYWAVLQAVRREVRKRGDQLTSFHLIYPALRMSSCLPDVARALRTGRWGGFDEVTMLADDLEKYFDLEDPQGLDGATSIPSQLRSLAAHDFELHDTKFEALLETLHLISVNQSLPSSDGAEVSISSKEKIVIFAFYKDTIAYLQRRLEARGYRCLSVTGNITDKTERDRLLRGFETDPTRILLCSEIGAEGVDLQFARVVVNYDLPWNPMRVEQRIGRIDRIGQTAPTIIIVSFNVLDTIDGSIYAHLYTKIGIFEQSIGALEGILGEAVSALTSAIFKEDLTQEQVAQRAEQTADTICHRARMEAELEQSSPALVAFQDLLSEKIGESQRLGRFIKPTELELHARDFLTSRFTGPDACSLLSGNPVPGCVECHLSFAALSQFENFCDRKNLPVPWPSLDSKRVISLCFDPAVHQRHKRHFGRLALVTHLHPFFQWITEGNAAANNRWHKVSGLLLMSDEFPADRYFYLVYRSTMEQITRRDTFHYALKPLSGGDIITGNGAELLLNRVLDEGESLFPGNTPDLSRCLRDLQEALAEELKSIQRNFRQDQQQKFAIRRQQLTSHFERRIDAQRRRIQTAEERGVEPHRVKGFRTALENLQARQQDQLDKLQEKAGSHRESASEVACGLIEVRPTRGISG